MLYRRKWSEGGARSRTLPWPLPMIDYVVLFARQLWRVVIDKMLVVKNRPKATTPGDFAQQEVMLSAGNTWEKGREG